MKENNYLKNMKTTECKVFRIHYKSQSEERYVLVESNSFKDAIDVFDAHMNEKSYEIIDITSHLDVIKPITKTITVEL